MTDYYCVKFADGDKMIFPSATSYFLNDASKNGKVKLFAGAAGADTWVLDKGSEIFSVEFAADAVLWMKDGTRPECICVWTVGQEGAPQ